jgi:urocanate hydratase
MQSRAWDQDAWTRMSVRLANWNYARRLIALARTPADLDRVDATMMALGVDDDLRLNRWFEAARRRIERNAA